MMETSNSQPEATLKFRVHRIRRMVYLRSLILFLLTLVGMLVSLSILIWQWQQTITNFGPAALLRWITIPFWATLFFSLLALISFTMLRRNRQRELQVSNMGLTIQRGKDLESIRWDDVVQVHTILEKFGVLGITWGNRAEIHLMISEGRKYNFNHSYERIDELIAEIKHFVYPRMFEQYRIAFNRGEPISFGPLILTSDGILNGRKALRWKDLKAIKMEGGSLKLRPFENSDGPRFSVPAHKVPNIDLCIQLINHLSPQT